jgi:deoxyribonuclease-4
MRKEVLLGAHMSIAGGLEKAIHNGKKLGCKTIQIFTKNNTQWRSRPLLENEVEKFVLISRNSNINPIFAHTSYLINLVSGNKTTSRKSYKSFIDEIQRAELLEIPYIVMHPGSTLGKSVKTGINIISDIFNKIFSEKKEDKLMICIETTAGQGSSIGYRFEQIAEIMEKIEKNHRFCVCLDTCHIFSAGYDIRNEKSYNKTMCEFESVIGLDRLKIIHMNDSKSELGSRIDRHQHIGKGFIGLKAFELIMNDEKLNKVPKIIETPKGKSLKEDIININLLRSLIK